MHTLLSACIAATAVLRKREQTQQEKERWLKKAVENQRVLLCITIA